MPSKSAKQHRLMAMVAHDPKAAKRLGIPQSVGRDYVEADKGREFGSGGSMKESKAMLREEMKYLKKGKAPARVMKHEAREHESMGMARKMKTKKMAGGGMSYSKGGAMGSYRRAADGIASKGKTKGKQVKMMRGGMC